MTFCTCLTPWTAWFMPFRGRAHAWVAHTRGPQEPHDHVASFAEEAVAAIESFLVMP